jgi:Ca-activated chloride channel homolog
MKYIGLISCAILTLGSTVCPADGQTQAYVASGMSANSTGSVNSTGYDATQSDIITIQKRVDEVNVLFIAMDKHGKFVRDLKKDDFNVLDDHKPPQSIVRFAQQTNLPLQLGLLIDTSGSIHGRFEFEQNAAAGFLEHTIRANYDHAFVMGFNARNHVAQDYTDNIGLLQTSIHHLEDGGGTALYDAIYNACKTHMMNDDSDRPVRRALIVVSDGEDNQSEHSRAQAIEMAQRAQVIVYTISTDDSGLIMRGDRVLQQLADSTGGRAFFPYKMKEIKNAFAAIEDELRSQYAISYHPADFDADGRYRSIQITALKKDLQVRARTGYFAPKQ